MALPKKTADCPCGETLDLPLYHNGLYYDINVRCGKCHRTGTSGNDVTGEVTGWMTEKDLDAVNDQYEIDNFSADMNEFHGRGEW